MDPFTDSSREDEFAGVAFTVSCTGPTLLGGVITVLPLHTDRHRLVVCVPGRPLTGFSGRSAPEEVMSRRLLVDWFWGSLNSYGVMFHAFSNVVNMCAVPNVNEILYNLFFYIYYELFIKPFPNML